MIDFHTHLMRGCTRAAAERSVAECGFDKAVVLALPLDHWRGELNERTAAIVAALPDRLVGFIGIHPPDVDESLRRIETFAAKGFVGIKLMPTAGYYPDDEKHQRVFEEINARKMIVVQHCGWCSRGWKEKDLPQSTRFSDPYHVEPLARIYTDTDFVLAHGGGRTFFPRAAELCHYHENIYIDTCPGQGVWVLRHGGPWLTVLNWDRVLFATDTGLGEQDQERAYHDRRYMIESLIGFAGFADRIPGVLHDNAARLLRKHGVDV